MLIFITKPVHWANAAGATEAPLPLMLLMVIHVDTRRCSSHSPREGTRPTDVPKQGCVPWGSVQSRRTVWVVGTELKVIQFSEGGGGMLQSQEFFSIRPSNKWRKTVARVFLLLPCSDQHSPHSLEIRHSYGWVEENRIFFFLQWDTP